MPLASSDLTEHLLNGDDTREDSPLARASKQEGFFRLPSHPRYHNPFETLTHIGRYEKLKIIVFTLTGVAPLRLVIILALGVLGMIPAKLALLGIPRSDDVRDLQPPITAWWRKALIHFMLLWVRIILFVAGFYWVNVEGSPDRRTRVYVSTHHSIWDTLYLMYYTGACEAAKSEVFDLPLVGTYLRVLSALPIDRRSYIGREAARRNMKERALDERYPPLIVFPTATCNNIRQMTEFKTGAFDTGLPVQPIGISYPCRFNDLYLDGSILLVLYRTLCQFINYETITFLPIYRPTPAEEDDPPLYAAEVRRVMCKKLHRVPVPFVFEDEMLRTACVDNRMSLYQQRLMMKDVFEEFDTSDRILEYWVGILHSIDFDGDGFISLQDVRNTFSLGPRGTRYVSRLFKILKQDDPDTDADVPPLPRRKESGWYSKIAGGVPAVPRRPKDALPANALAVHEIVPMLLVLYNAAVSRPRHRHSLELLYSAFYFPVPTAVLDETELATAVCGQLTRYIPDLFNPPMPRRNTISTADTPSSTAGTSTDEDTVTSPKAEGPIG
ncbi:Lysophosphatidylcholine acyltransferase 2 [Perkinsus olseni]|uniref:Lysophosphatidylcholine acyltransferase 2 n=1 Tax=Perkinsus olseni TaxID=32597 RepID=A0A7J6RXJ8_PEROL|nr:Lysophosphatidylcholine acyltransferase 2 [Perkinsus olseni]